MNLAKRTLCHVLVGLLVVLPACAQKPVPHTTDVKRLLVDYRPPPSPWDASFEPVPEEERLKFELPEPKPYQLGVGDVVQVRVLSAQPVTGYEGTLELRVKEDGNLYLPLVGKIEAKDKTALQLEEQLTTRFQEDYVRDALVSMDVVGFGARKFYVVGEVGQPSQLPVDGKTTLLESLIRVGGTNFETADLEEAYIIREMKPMPFSVRELVMRGHPAGRMVMEEGDIVFIPHIKDRLDHVYVFGQVGRQAQLPMEHTEGPRGGVGTMTLASAIAQAGGIQPTADINDVRIYRGGWQNPKRFKIGIEEVYQYGEQIHLMPGDRIAVGMSDSAVFNETIGPPLRVITATSSVLSLAVSALALSRN